MMRIALCAAVFQRLKSVFICVHLWQKFGLGGLSRRANLKMVTFGHFWSRLVTFGWFSVTCRCWCPSARTLAVSILDLCPSVFICVYLWLSVVKIENR